MTCSPFTLLTTIVNESEMVLRKQQCGLSLIFAQSYMCMFVYRIAVTPVETKYCNLIIKQSYVNTVYIVIVYMLDLFTQLTLVRMSWGKWLWMSRWNQGICSTFQEDLLTR